MDLSPGYDAPAVRTLVGADGSSVPISFPRLDWSQVKALGQELKQSYLNSANRLAEECRLQPWERFRALQEIDRGVSVPAVQRFAGSAEGAEKITMMQAAKAGIDDATQEKIWRALGPVGRVDLAIDLVSAADPVVPKAATEGPVPPNPSTPPTP